MLDEPLFQLTLARVIGQRQKIERVRILERLLCKVGLRRRQGLLEIGQRLALPLMSVGLDLHREYCP